MDDWYVAIDVIFQDVKEQLCYFKSMLAITKNGCVTARLDKSALEPEIQTDNYKILCCDRKRHREEAPYRGGVT